MGQTDFSADVIVLGLGAMGSAATYQLAKRGARVIGLDQFSPPHPLGSTHGDTRLTRQAIGEGEAYTPFALRSYELWREIEAGTGADLLTITGGLILADPTRRSVAHGISDFLGNTIRSAQKYGIAHKLLSTHDIQSRYPQLKLGGNEAGYFEENAGFLRPERCIEAQLELAHRHGATIRTGEKVVSFVQESNGVRVRTNRAQYIAQKLIISAGPWVSDFMGSHNQGLFKVYRQVLYWFGVESSSYPSFTPENFPVFIWDFGSGEGMYGFPAIDGPSGGIKLAQEQYEVTTDPNDVNRTVTPEETNLMFERFVEPHFHGITRECIKATTCLYTVTPDSGFVIDVHPQHKDIILASPCSGHGFKHSAAIGEALAQLAIQGHTDLDVSPFSLKRFL